MLLVRVGLKTGDVKTLTTYDDNESFTQYGKFMLCAGPDDLVNVTVNGITLDLNGKHEINWPINSITVNSMRLRNDTGNGHVDFTTTGSTLSGVASTDACVLVMGAKHNKREY